MRTCTPVSTFLPQAPATHGRAPGEVVEQAGVRCVRRERKGASESLADQVGVDHLTSQVDVGEQPAVIVAALAVEYQAHRVALDRVMVEGARLGTEALNGRIRLD